MKISTALDKIDEKQLFVPAFQREYVWQRDDAKQLVDSLIKEYPTGTMLTWETDRRLNYCWMASSELRPCIC